MADRQVLRSHERDLVNGEIDDLEIEHQDAILNIMRMADGGKLTEADQEELLDRCDGEGPDLFTALANSSPDCAIDLEQLVLGPGYTSHNQDAYDENAPPQFRGAIRGGRGSQGGRVVQRGETRRQLSTVNKHQGSAFTQRPIY